MAINGAQETFTGCYSFTCGFHCSGNMLGGHMGTWVHQLARCLLTWCK